MRSPPDCYEKIIRFMEERNASVSPLKTREIADGCELLSPGAEPTAYSGA